LTAAGRLVIAGGGRVGPDSAVKPRFRSLAYEVRVDRGEALKMTAVRCFGDRRVFGEDGF
jgi:hypothetical protein